MSINFLLKGMILGFSIAAPVGPIGVLCIRKTVQFGRFSGLFSGLGAAFADSIYAIIAAFGLTAISSFLLAGQFWLRLIGGVFLLFLGWKTIIAKPAPRSEKNISHTTLLNDFLSTFFLTITNPITILSFLAVFAGLGLSSVQGDYFEAGALVLGVFLGSVIWWLLLSEGVTLFRKKISQKVMTWINRIAGLIILGFGVGALLSAIF
ncbi:MAG TPA: LysE family translocator [Rhabdochlamydiaceae bacterium]|jgi:threonine/homoserine/homoserine lactone efflux protein